MNNMALLYKLTGRNLKNDASPDVTLLNSAVIKNLIF